jgi:hypothetical protein
VRFIPNFLNFSTTLQHARNWRWAIKNLHDIPFAAVKDEFVSQPSGRDSERPNGADWWMTSQDNGIANPSFAYNLLSKYAHNEENGIPNSLTLKDIQGASGSVFIAGSNTVSRNSPVQTDIPGHYGHDRWSFPQTLATTTVALLNLMQNPDVFQKARRELDSVVGVDRLPALSDRPNLRYIDYLVEETTRWRPLSPIGIPHKSIQDDVYNGMFIPAG